MMLTLSHSRCMNSISSGFNPCPDGAMKYRHTCTRESGMAIRWTRDSAVRYSSYLFSTNSTMGTQLRAGRKKKTEVNLFELFFWIPLEDGHRAAVTYQLLLSTAVPKPGVSTTVSVRLTPFSFSNTFVLSTVTVFLIRFDGPGCCSGWYTSDRNSELISVDFPRPASPVVEEMN